MDPLNSYYLWLIPQKEMYGAFQMIIKGLSKLYTTPVFEPHITLSIGLSGDENDLIKKTDAFVRKKYKFSVNTKDIKYTQGFLKALFLNIANTPAINEFNAQAVEHFKPLSHGPFQPHMSLLYGDITPDEKERIIAELNFLPRTITFDKLKLIKGHPDVTQWQVIREWSLI